MAETADRCTRCGAPLDATPVAGPGQGMCPGCLLRAGMEPPFPIEKLSALFPHLEVCELIGKGGMGAVYRARQRSLDRDVALKLLPAHLVDEPGFTERFLREARALARLDHPHIVRVFDHGCVEGHHFLVLEYVDGLNLRQVMRRRVLSPAESLALVPQICDALQYAHDRGVVHRDVKPENILVDTAGRVKIADFGLARISHGEDAGRSRLTATHQVMGTPQYMAPEQMEGFREVDHRADIYSLGIVFYEMLTGELPMGRFDPPSKRVSVDVALDEVVLKALEREPERRYQQAGEVKTAVEGLEASPVAAADAANTEAEEFDAEGVLGMLLCQLLPWLAFMGVIWSGSWLPLTILLIPAVSIGYHVAGRVLDDNAQYFLLMVYLVTFLIIGASMWKLSSATPLFALLLFVLGLLAGKAAKEKKQKELAAAK